MKGKIHVTVAICTWNRCALLRETLEQMTKMVVPTDVEWDLLVVNNCCTDTTDDVIASFADNLPIRRLFEPKPGTSHARNLALREGRGDYILWTDDDVLVDEHWLQAFAQTARRYPNAAIIGGPIEPWFPITPDSAVIAAFPIVATGFCGVDHRLEEGPVPEKLYVWTANMGVRSAAISGLVFDPGLGHSPASFRAGEDEDFVDRIRQQGGIVIWSPHMRVRHYVDPSRMTRAYLRKYAIGLGENWIRNGGVPPGPQIFGAPRWLWKQCLGSYVRYGVTRMLPPGDDAFVRLRDHFRFRGAVRECRAISRGAVGDRRPPR